MTDAATTFHTELRGLLRSLAVAGAAEVTTLPPNVLKVREELVKRWPPLHETEIDTYTQANKKSGDLSNVGGKVLYLPVVSPTKRPRVVLAAVSYDHDKDPAFIAVQVALFLAYQSHKQPPAYGYRFEAPHLKVTKVGDHDYFHVQPIKHIRMAPPGGAVTHALDGLGGWFPDDAPTVPLDAADVIDLVTCVLLSLYGHRGARQLDTGQLSGRLRARFKSMRTLGR